jgi:hypothetical protein
MKRIFYFGFILLTAFVPVFAGTHFGLGSAVADHDSKIIHQERTNSNPLNLPVCTATPYTVSPIELATTFYLEPLGHMAGVGGHLFPTDHIYFYVPKATATTPTTNIYAPGDMTIYQVASSEYLNAVPRFTDYTIRFSPCQGLTGFYYHVGALSADLQAKIGSINQSCFMYPDNSIYYCNASVAIKVNAGDLLGTITGRVGHSFTTLDLGSYDRNQPALSFISPARHYQDELYTRCPLEPFQEPLKSLLSVRLGKYDGSVFRTIPPVCGEIMQDLPGTAQGLWYVPGTPQSTVQDISPHLALVHDNVVPTTGVFSVGNSMSASGLTGTQYFFQPTATGVVNLDFNLVTSNSTVYCYENFQNLFNSIILLQLPTSTTLKIEKQTAASCGTGPWAFTSNASQFER